ncbi:MAG: translocase [Paracoccaceae bacterium]
MFSAARPWSGGVRANTGLPERRVKEVKPADRVVLRALSYVRRASLKPGFADWRETRRVLRVCRRLDDVPEQELVEEIRTLGKSLLKSGFRGAGFIRATAIVRQITGRKLGMWFHPVQVMGGMALARGRIIEMATGEGKTITTLIPAVLAAMTGHPVHVVTVNAYLAARDRETLAPVLDAFGLTHAVISSDTDYAERPGLHNTDVVFITNSDLTFDYLRDRIAFQAQRTALNTLVQQRFASTSRQEPRNLVRGLGFAVIDEVDSILIDEAQTPLIITAEKPGDDNARALEDTVLTFARTLEEGRHYKTHFKERRIELLPAIDPLIESFRTPFPDLATAQSRRDAVGHALSALHLYLRDEHYILTDDGLAIVDEFAGRVLPDRQWQKGLHQMIEAKEELERSPERETLAQITYQSFFNRFLWFSGMTGTAQEVARELHTGFDRRVFRLPTNKRPRRRLFRTRLYGTSDRRWRAVVRHTAKMVAAGRPVLIGTRSVKASEHISTLLSQSGLDHVVLNARQNAEEAEIVARAGQPGQITVATNMAGRGTDIPVKTEVEDKGGLHVVLTEFHNSARIDRQLIGRTARQGQRGTAVCFVSLDDPLFSDMLPLFNRALRGGLGVGPFRLPSTLAELQRNLAQARAERQGRRQRRSTIQRAEKLQKSLGFAPDNI